jgi:hypothetical protein
VQQLQQMQYLSMMFNLLDNFLKKNREKKSSTKNKFLKYNYLEKLESEIMMTNNFMQARLWNEYHFNENHAQQWMFALRSIASTNHPSGSKPTRNPQPPSQHSYHKTQVNEIRTKCQDLKREFYAHVKNQRVYQAKETIERLQKANEFNGKNLFL